jgi:hypothetical protein
MVLIVALAEPTFAQEDDVRLRITLTHQGGDVRIAYRNVGEDPFCINRSQSVLWPWFQKSGLYLRVVDEKGVERVLTAKINVSGLGFYLFLNAGDEFSTVFNVDLNVTGLYGLEPGRYTVTVFYKNSVKLDRKDCYFPAFIGSAMSNPIQVEVSN